MPVSRNHHIQALRGVAASLVVLSHALDVVVEHGILPLWFRPVGFSIGGLGVTTFFVISGFIMINISYEDFGRLPNSISFAKRRIMRIVPTYWIATILAFILYQIAPLSRQPSIVELVKSLTFIPYATNPISDMQPVLGQGWTLNYEMFFYTLFAIALMFPRRIGLPVLFMAFFGIVAAGAWIKPLSDASPAKTVSEFLSDPIILLFATGMVIGILKRQLDSRWWYLRYPFWIAVAFLAIQVTCNIVFEIPSRVPFPASILTWITAALAVVACTFAMPSHSGRFEAVSEALGDASYSTYLFHIFLVAPLKMMFPIISVTTAIAFVLAALLVSNLFGLVFYRTIERPIAAMFRKTALMRPLPLAQRAA